MNWNEDKPAITEAYFAAINASNVHLFGIIKDNYEKLKQVFPLIEYVIERIEAVTTLTMSEQVWDADIIVRSALETLVKFAFIVEADEKDRPLLLREFWNDLSEIYTLKLSEQGKKNLKHTSQSEIHRLAYSPLVLTEIEEEKLRNKWPKKLRSQMEQKWSFSGIVNFIAQKNKGTPMENIEFITHTYRMSSHITHGDEIGISLIRERNSREENDREAVHIAHYLRLLSDSFYYCCLTALYTLRYLKIKDSFFSDLSKSLKEVQSISENYHKVPFEDKMYDKYR